VMVVERRMVAGFAGIENPFYLRQDADVVRRREEFSTMSSSRRASKKASKSVCVCAVEMGGEIWF
jgi:hypothetical protein